MKQAVCRFSRVGDLGLPVGSLSRFTSHRITRHLVKQGRLPFPSFDHRTDKPFDLIHIDILGSS